MVVIPHESHNPHCHGYLFTILVWAVGSGKCLIHIGNGHNLRLRRHIVMCQSLGITCPVQLLMVAAGKLRHVFQMFRIRELVQHVDSDDNVVIDNLSFFRKQCPFGNVEVPNVFMGEKRLFLSILPVGVFTDADDPFLEGFRHVFTAYIALLDELLIFPDLAKFRLVFPF